MKCVHCKSELVPIDINIDGDYIKVWMCNCKSDYDMSDSSDKRKNDLAKQREKYGFDERETWSLQTQISHYILPRLKLFKRMCVGRPANVATVEEWNDILDKIIKSFEISSLIFETDVEPQYNINTEEGYKSYEEGMELFKEYFLDLWY